MVILRWVVLVIFVWTNTAYACAFHGYSPEQTLVDRVIASPNVVLARPAPNNPYAFAPTRTLRGTAPDSLPTLVSSVYRKRLALNPEDTVLFVQEDGEWNLAAYTPPDYQDIVITALENAGEWKDTYTRDWLELFATLLTDDDPDLRQLALREVDKAPYALLREITAPLPVEQMVDDLWTLEGFTFQSIHVLLLGISDSDIARAEVKDFLTRTQSLPWANTLGAFSVAEIELNGVQGVETLRDLYLTDPGQSLEKLEQVIEAFAIQSGVDHPKDLAAALDAAMGDMLRARPDAAAALARQFGSRRDWRHGDALTQVLRGNHLPQTAGLLEVAMYVAQARSEAKP